MVAERGIVQVGPQALAPVYETDWDEVKRVFAGMVNKNANTPEIAAAIIVCQQLGFNPILNHIFLIKGQVYVSHKGLLNLAHRNPAFDGIALLEEAETQTHWTAKVAVYRRDMGHPFIYTGRYPKAGDKKQYGPEMAVTRAETMALRRAFDVSMPIYEEINWQAQPSQGPAVAVREVPPSLLAAPAQPPEDSQFVATVRQLGADGVTVREISEFVNSEWDNLTEAEQLAGTDALEAIKAERRAAKAARQQQPAAPIEATVVATPAPDAAWGWTEMWSWLRARGINSRADIDRTLDKPSTGMTVTQIKAALEGIEEIGQAEGLSGLGEIPNTDTFEDVPF